MAIEYVVCLSRASEMTKRQLLAASLVTTLLLLTGCASIHMGDPAKSAAIKNFEKTVDMAQIYVCRNSRTFGMAIRPDIELDQNIIATVARSTFAYAEVMPGNHTLVAKTLEHDSKLPFTVKPGEQRFFQTWISIGFLAGWGLIEEIDAEAGKACVTDGELVEAVKVNNS